jgi:hypothetical protein
MKKKPTRRQQAIIEHFVKQVLKEEDPNYRKKAHFKYSDRNKFLTDRTVELFHSEFYKDVHKFADKIMDELRDKLSVEDISFGRTAGSDLKIIRSVLRREIIKFMNDWTG